MKVLTLTDAHYDELVGMLNDYVTGLYSERNVRLRHWHDKLPLFAAIDLRLEPREDTDDPDWPSLVKLDERAPSRSSEQGW